jgi:tRNA pseudouridine55 synthase
VRVAREIARALVEEKARTLQVPPAFSAVHVGGERAHERARRGDEVDLEPRPVEVHTLRLLDAADDANGSWLTVFAEVSKGYYVRALARDLARALGTVGHLTALRRTRSGSFRIEEALPADTPADELEARVISLRHAATRVLPPAYLTDAGAENARHGRAVRPADIDAAQDFVGPCAWFDPKGALLAVGEVGDDGMGHVLRGFGDG